MIHAKSVYPHSTSLYLLNYQEAGLICLTNGHFLSDLVQICLIFRLYDLTGSNFNCITGIRVDKDISGQNIFSRVRTKNRVTQRN